MANQYRVRVRADDCIECPVCGVGGIMVRQGKIPRHERGLCYMPYRLYKKFERHGGTPLREIMQKNKCLASNRTPKEAELIAQKQQGGERCDSSTE